MATGWAAAHGGLAPLLHFGFRGHRIRRRRKTTAKTRIVYRDVRAAAGRRRLGDRGARGPHKAWWGRPPARAGAAALAASLILFGCSSPLTAPPGATRSAIVVPPVWIPLALSGVAVDSTTAVVVGAGGLIWTAAAPVASGSPLYSRTSGTALDLTAIASGSVGGSAGFVAVGAGGTILTSSDGVSWSGHSLAAVQSLSGVCYGNNTWVAVGPNFGQGSGTIVTSTNGTSWTVVSSSATPQLTGCAWGGSTFVAVGQLGVILTSPDGSSWSPQSSVTTANLSAVAFGLVGATPTFVAVGDGGTILTSTAGTAWTSAASNTTEALRAVAAGTIGGGAGFAAVGANGTIVTSTDATTWTVAPSGTTAYLDGIASDGANFLWVGQPSAGAPTVAVGAL